MKYGGLPFFGADDSATRRTLSQGRTYSRSSRIDCGFWIGCSKLVRWTVLVLALVALSSFAVDDVSPLPMAAGATSSPGAITSPGADEGYWLVSSGGGIYNYGDAPFYGSTGGQHLNAPIVGMAATPDGQGYWLVASDGGIFTYGDASFYGSTGGLHLNAPIVGMAATPDGQGYWLVSSDGGIFAYGDATFYGSTGGMHLNQPVVAMTATPDGAGYWLVSSDGGIFAYGDAAFYGSTGGMHLNKPVVAMTATPDGAGYWLVSSDGGIFSYGDAAFYGSTGGIDLNKPVVAMAATPDGGGYWLVASDGGIFSYGDAPFYGSPGSALLNEPVVGIGMGNTLRRSGRATISMSAPAAPPGLTAAALSSSSLSVTWTNESNAQAGGVGVADYTVSCTGGGCSTPQTVPPTDGSTTSVTLSGLTASTKYDVSLTATNQSNLTGPPSTTAATTQAPVTVTPSTSTTTAQQSASGSGEGSIVIGPSGTVTDTATVTGNTSAGAPSGTVTFTECGPSTSTSPCLAGTAVGSPVSLGSSTSSTSSATSASFKPTAIGTYCFAALYTPASGANYLGSSDNMGASADLNECFTVTPAPSTTTAQQSASGSGEGSIVIGPSGTVTDTATVTGNTTAGAPSGTVTFTVCGPSTSTGTCTSGTAVGSPVSLSSSSSSASSATSASFKPTTIGTYCFAALYTPTSGSNYSGSSDNMGTAADQKECFSAGSTPSTTTAQQSAGGSGEGSIVIGSSVTDTATVGGITTVGAPTGTVTFTVCGPSTSTSPCTSGTAVGSPVSLTSAGSSTSSATSASFKPTAVGTYCFAALYTPASGSNYSGSSDNTGTTADADECLTVTPAPSTTTAQQSASGSGEGSIVIGPSGTVTDTATVTGTTTAGAPTGTVTFTECGPSTSTSPCTSGTAVGSPVSLASSTSSTSSATSASFKPTTVGTYCFAALYTPASGSNYSGSSDNKGTTADADECLTVTAAPSTTTAQQSASGSGEGSIVVGSSVTDTATLSGTTTAGAPTGTVTFTECGPSTSTQSCTSGTKVGSAVSLSSVSSSASGATSASFTPTATGTYCFAALYTPASGSNYSGSSDNAGTTADVDECLTVTAAGSTTSAQQSASESSEGSIVTGSSVTDTATVSGTTAAGAPSGTVTFTECGPSTSTEPCPSGTQVGSAVTLSSVSSSASGATSASFTPTAAGTYCFGALYTPASGSKYSGSSDNTGTTADANECFTASVASSTWSCSSETTTGSCTFPADTTDFAGMNNPNEQDGLGYEIGQDVWSPMSGQTQELQANSAQNYVVTSNTPTNSSGSVTAYPNVGTYAYTGVLDDYTSLTSTYDFTMPINADTSAWATTDDWLSEPGTPDGTWTYEVQIHVDSSVNSAYNCPSTFTPGTSTSRGNYGVVATNISIGGSLWYLCDGQLAHNSNGTCPSSGCGELIFKSGATQGAVDEPQTTTASGTLDLKGFFQWLEDNDVPGQTYPYIQPGSALTNLSQGWEISSTDGTSEQFVSNGFTLDATGAPAPPSEHPSGITFTPSGTSCVLSWSADASATRGYDIYWYGGGTGANEFVGSGTSYSVTAPAGTVVSAELASSGNGGQGPWAPYASCTIP